MGNRLPTEGPTSPAEHVAQDVVMAAKAIARASDRELLRIVVMLDVKAEDPEEPGAAMYGHGDFEDNTDVMAYMLSHVRVLAKANGMEMDIMALPDEPPTRNQG